MAYALGLTLYNLSARPAGAETPVWPARPPGRLVWLHAPDAEALAVLCQLAHRLAEEDGVQAVLTAPPEAGSGGNGATRLAPPPDTPRAAESFLAHWRPEVAIFAGDEILPATLNQCTRSRVPTLLVNARPPRLIRGREGWYPGLMRTALHSFHQIMAVDATADRALRKAGAEGGQIIVTGRMEMASAALPHVESDRAALAALCAARPVWLAADVTAAELPLVIAAHAAALQLAHRLLLILVPQDPAVAPALVEKLEADQDWRVALRRAEQDPGPEIEVLIGEAAEYGLWYRLAPVTFLGGSLEGAGSLRDPMEAAALGSAILCGPKGGAHGAAFARLGAARAARMVASGPDLAEALADLLSPDRAARQASAAWTIATEGTEATDGVLDTVRRLMDGAA